MKRAEPISIDRRLWQRPLPRRRTWAGRIRLAAARAGYRPDHADALALGLAAAAAVVAMLAGAR